MTWNYSAHGFLGDVTAAEKFAAAIGELFSRPEFGTMGTSFSGPGVSRTDLHLAAKGSPDNETEAAGEPPLQGAEPSTSPVGPEESPALTGAGGEGQGAEVTPPAQ